MQRSRREILKPQRRTSCDLDTNLHFVDQAPTITDSEMNWVVESSATTSLRNQVLVQLQEQERKGLMVAIKETRDSIVNTWKRARRPVSAKFPDQESPPQSIDSRRLENISWRLWFRDNLMRREREESNDVDFLGSILTLPRRLQNPQDIYSNVEPDEEGISPKSPNQIRRMIFG